MTEIALLVPFDSNEATWIDPLMRRAWSPAHYRALEALHRLEEWVRRPLLDRRALPEAFVPSEGGFRSLTAVVLATALEQGGLRWTAVDPGARNLRWWAKRLEALRAERPRVVAVATTFVGVPAFGAAMCALVRRFLPDAKLLVGGSMYGTDVRSFLSLDADVLCIGEGEARIATVARRMIDGASLDDVPGLYVRDGDRLRFTGKVEPLDLDHVPLPDWSLATRMDPPVRPDLGMNFHVETQRGCTFKCEFCTFRTLAAPTHQSVERAVEAILAPSRIGPGAVFVVDATASIPRDRWRAILEGLAARGGSPNFLSVFTRTSDLDDETCALMVQAGVRNVYLGQESGSQRILNAMKKGTRVDQVRPAMAALSRHGLTAEVSFIHGFPGEDAESLRETREMLLGLNADVPDRLAVLSVWVNVFELQDFAAIHGRDSLQGSTHRFDYGVLPMGARRAADEVLTTYLAASRVPHAPITGFGVCPALGAGITLERPAPGGGLPPNFVWAKAVERGIATFLEAELEGRRPRAGALRAIRAEIHAGYPAGSRDEPVWKRTLRKVRNHAARALTAEWCREERAGVGLLTRLHLAHTTWALTSEARDAARAAIRGEFPSAGFRPVSETVDVQTERDVLARELIDLGVAVGRLKRARTRPPASETPQIAET